jgi:hypothetical protein
MHKMSWIAALLVITGVIVAIDIYFDQHYIGATARFVWNAIAFSAQSLARSAEAVLALAFRRRFTRVLTSIITAVNVVYVSHIFLNDRQVRTAIGWREKLRLVGRKFATNLRDLWLKLPFAGKIVVVVLAIWAQIHFLPNFAAWIVLFPVAFLIPPLQWAWRTLSSLVVDNLFGDWYWQKYAKKHRSFMGWIKSIPVLREVRGGWRMTRLRYITAWRMWRYEECYRIAKSERRRISLFEPIRLWWLGELDRYIGRHLCNGPKDWPPTTYHPPVLWYDQESPHAEAFRRVIGAGAMLTLAFTLRSSARR